jgi:chemotaxis protein MotB
MADQVEIKSQPDILPVVKTGTVNNNLWLVIFTDLVALMLAFFVLLFSMSTVKLSDWQSLVQSLSETLSPEEKKKIPVAQSNFNIESIFRGEASNLDYLMSIISEAVDGNGVLSKGQIVRREDRLVFVLPRKELFKTNRSELTETGQEALFDLGGVLRNIDNEIAINGHSGTETLSEIGYTSNWELSIALAISIANTLRQSGFSRPIAAYGYADKRPKPVEENLATKDQFLAGYVEIVIRPEAGAS